MKYTPKQITWSALTVLFLILIFLPSPDKIGVESPVREGGASLLSTSSVVRSKYPPQVLDLEFPVLTGGDEEVQKKVNADIKRNIDRTVAEFKNGMRPASPDFAKMENTLTVRHEIAYSNPYIASFELKMSSYAIGDAHPGSWVETYNYDLRNGARIALRDMFLPDSSYLQTISAYSIEALARELGVKEEGNEDMAWIRRGAAPEARNFENFLIAKEGLVIIFNPYQVSPGAEGSLRISVPYAILEKISDPAGVLALRRF